MEAPREYERPETKAEQWVTTYGPQRLRAKASDSWSRCRRRPGTTGGSIGWRIEPWLNYWLHRNYTKPLGGVADEYDRIWAPDYPVTVQFTVPLLVAMKARAQLPPS